MKIRFLTAITVVLISTVIVVWKSPRLANAKTLQTAQSANPNPSPNYIGNVTRVEMNPKVRTARLHFESGARTKWHSHEHGQILLCEEGLARTQVKGGPVLDLRVGETAYVSSRVPHWHGASPGHSATLLSIDIGNGTDIWMDEVTEAEYNAKPAK
jgi:quercetin dioxygenase-like cupin family protein